ncbi:hypothetical protein B0H16DRAFT_1519924 [Mycena metata]|uniref:Helicase C-terminal domain-containing protein n=1 Tax=Mycena metata TaxID=1033252 RepID=A0AAD7JSD1_9AGAR|nr:hypothetical protein B0H16DRAFT_1519924 [Mycena metata]
MLSRCRLKLGLPPLTSGRRLKSTKSKEPQIVRAAPLRAFTLKPWEEDAIQACMTAINDGRTKIGVHAFGVKHLTMLPTLLDSIPPSPHARLNTPHTLVVAAESSGMATKIAEKLAQQRVNWKVEVDGKKAVGPSTADLLVTTYTMLMQDRVQKEGSEPRFIMSTLKAIVLSDFECCTPRRDFDTVWSRLFGNGPDELEAVVPPHTPIVIATTASEEFNTLRRLDHIEEVVYRQTFLDSILVHWECNPSFLAIPAPIGLRSVKVKGGLELNPHSLSKVMRVPRILRSTLQAWLDHAASTRKSTVIYCVDDPHAKALETLFQGFSIDARWLKHASKNEVAFNKGMAEFRDGQFPVLIVTHGKTVDAPRIDCVLLAAPTVNRTVLASQLLSAMKASQSTGKKGSLIIEMVDTSRRKRTPVHVYDFTDLFQLAHAEIQGQTLDVLRERAKQVADSALEEDLKEQEQKRVERANVPQPTPRPVAEKLEKPTRVLDNQAPKEQRDETLDTANKFRTRHWVRCGPGVYLHDCYRMGHAIIRLKEGSQGYEAYWNPVALVAGVAYEGPSARWLSGENFELTDILHRVTSFLDTHAPAKLAKHRMYKASDWELQTLRELHPSETMRHVLLEGKPMPRDEFFEFLSTGDASDALARLRTTDEQDPVIFTYAEQALILKRIQRNKPPKKRPVVTPKMLEKGAINEERALKHLELRLASEKRKKMKQQG